MKASSGIRGRRFRSGSTTVFVGLLLLMTAMVGGGLLWFFSRKDKSAAAQPILVSVSRGDFSAQVLDQGEVQSSENIEIRCEVRPAGGSIAVIEVVPEGSEIINTEANPRDKDKVLVRLDSKAFEKDLDQQRLAVTNAETAVIQAKASLDAAVVAKREYEEGLYVEKRKTIENEIYNAQQEVEQAEAYLAYSTKLHKKGFYSTQQLKGDRIAVQRARNSYELALKKLEVLENVTREKEFIKLDADIRAAEVKYNNEQEAQRIEQAKLAEIEAQIANCVIKPPANVSGQVVYHKESGRGGGTDWVLAEGATVRERQVLMRIPNPSRMEVRALINEQSITAIRPGMPAVIRIDALHGGSLKGFVTSVSQYAQNDGFFSGSIKKFPVLVQIIDPPFELKPGMNGSVSIQTVFRPDAVQVPVQCVYAAGDQRYCLVKRGDRYETVEIEVSADNAKNVLVEQGLKDGEQVVMNPGNYRELLTIPELAAETKIELPEGVTAQYQRGEAAVGEGGPEAGPPAGGGSGGPPAGEGGGAGRGEGASPEGRPDRRGGGGGGEGRGRFGGGNFDPEQIVSAMMERMDGNGDGVIEESELPEQARERMKASDADGDGKITREEMLEGMRRRMQEGGGGGGGGGPPGGPPGGP